MSLPKPNTSVYLPKPANSFPELPPGPPQTVDPSSNRVSQLDFSWVAIGSQVDYQK